MQANLHTEEKTKFWYICHVCVNARSAETSLGVAFNVLSVMKVHLALSPLRETCSWYENKVHRLIYLSG